jgi:hypothetical protein
MKKIITAVFMVGLMIATVFSAASSATIAPSKDDEGISEGLPAMIHGYVRAIKGLRLIPLEGVEIIISKVANGETVGTDVTNKDGHYIIDDNIKRFKWYSVSINVDREDIFPLGRLSWEFTAKRVTAVNAVFLYIGNIVVQIENKVEQSIQNQQSNPNNI